MLDTVEEEYADTLEVKGDTKSSARVLAAIKKAERAFNPWQATCDTVDEVYSGDTYYMSGDWGDAEYDLFWASIEVLKQAVYARPPLPVVSPQFKDRRKLQNLTAELLERTTISAFDRTDMNEAMYCTRDDLIFYGRGQLWVTYETDEKGGGQRICVEHLDRKDFLHPSARKWSEVPWVARRAWMTKKEMRKRFRKISGDAYMSATLALPTKPTDMDGAPDNSRKAGVWEVWHKADDKVYWVAEGCSVMLDEDEPHLNLHKFFPCPRPAYATLRPRTLVPVPDYVRYRSLLNQINRLTRRIYDLLDSVRMKGLIPAGGDVGDAVEQLIRDDTNATMLIPVPGAALLASGGASSFVQWLPLEQIAAAIAGLIESRREMFSDFDRLSGISDIMRGETEAEETLGAQQLKSQYGSVRVRGKVDELQRIARDVTQIAAEIEAEHFSKETLLEMSQMEIPTKREIAKQVDEIEAAATKELKELADKAKMAAAQAQQSGQQVDPAEAQQQFQQAQQQIVAKYGPMLKQASEQVPIEDVMDLLRDDKARGFAFEIETSSTIMTDELQEKAARKEFLGEFLGASQGLTALTAAGPAGAKLAGEMLKFAMQPYRVGRELNGVIDEFIESASQMPAQEEGGGEAEAAMAQANMQIAQAELKKAEAAIAKVQVDAQSKQQEMQLKMSEAQAKSREAEQKFALELEQTRGNIAETEARIAKIAAEIQLAQQKLGLEAHREQREDIKTAADIQMRETDQAMNAMNSERDAQFRGREMERGDRQQSFSEQQAQRGEDRADRQQDFAETQAQRERAE